MFTGKPIPTMATKEGFVAHTASSYSNEADANISWTGPNLPYIPSKKYLHAPLDTKVQALIDTTWKAVSPREGAGRARTAIIGGQRGAGFGVAPTFVSAAPVGYGGLTNLEGAGHLKTVVPTDWKLMRDMPRVSAYAFRGDTRNPAQIRAVDGFQSPITRTDEHYKKNVIFPLFKAYLEKKLGAPQALTYDQLNVALMQVLPTPEEREAFAFYNLWRSQVERESMHIGRMLAQETLKGYVSTTKATPVAKAFAKKNGWVYLVLVKSGFLVPAKGTHPWTSLFGEQEIASPKPIHWKRVVAFRQVSNQEDRHFTGPIYVRPEFIVDSNEAFRLAFQQLSGWNQTGGAPAV